MQERISKTENVVVVDVRQRPIWSHNEFYGFHL